jgi:hypothetical protein
MFQHLVRLLGWSTHYKIYTITETYYNEKVEGKNPLAVKNLNLPSHTQTWSWGASIEGRSRRASAHRWLSVQVAEALSRSRTPGQPQPQDSGPRPLRYAYHSAPCSALGLPQNIKAISVASPLFTSKGLTYLEMSHETPECIPPQDGPATTSDSGQDDITSRTRHHKM